MVKIWKLAITNASYTVCCKFNYIKCKLLVRPRLKTGMVLHPPFSRKMLKFLKMSREELLRWWVDCMSSLTLQGSASWNSQLLFIEEDGVMPFWFINLLIQRQFLVFFLWRLRILVRGDITSSYPGISPQSGNAPIFLPTVLPTSGTNYGQITLLPKPQTALRTILTTNGQNKNGSITGKHSNWNQQHQTTSQCVLIQLWVMCYQLWSFYKEKSLYCSKLQF